MYVPSAKQPQLLRQGVRACREDNWWEGLTLLTRLATQDTTGRLPGFFYSYLGLAMARCQGRRREGLELCRFGVKVQQFLPENHINYARVCLLLRRRRSALRALERAAAIDPGHPEILEVRRLLGVRRRPPLPFLPRSSMANRLIGRFTWGLRRRQTMVPEAELY